MVRVGIIGLGNHGLRHVKAIKLNNRMKVVAICDKDNKNFKAASKYFPEINYYSNFKDLIKKEKLDLVSIVTNGPSHASIIQSAIENSIKYIFCEKPMCTSMHDAKKIIKQCEKAKTRFTIGYIRRFSSDYLNLINIINKGAIGRPRHYHFTVGSGLFAAVGIHYLDLFRMISQSEPVEVFGKLGSLERINPRGRQFNDPGAFATYLFEDKSRAVIDIMEDIGVPPKFEIIGSIGRIIIHGDEETGAKWTLFQRKENDKKESLKRYDLNLQESVIRVNKFDIIQLLSNGYNSLLSNDKLISNVKDGAKGVEMLLATHISSKENRIVRFPLSEEKDNFTVPFT